MRGITQLNLKKKWQYCHKERTSLQTSAIRRKCRSSAGIHPDTQTQTRLTGLNKWLHLPPLAYEEGNAILSKDQACML